MYKTLKNTVMEELSKFNIETQKTWRNYQNLTLKPRKHGGIIKI